jgi:autotransporter strand-loop-strand O-heptosyltransferase
MAGEETAEITQAEWRAKLNATFEEKRIPHIPGMLGPGGLRMDFCWGLRILTPPAPANRSYRVKMVDLDSEAVLEELVISADEYYVSPCKFFVRWGVQISDADTGEKLWQHKYDAENRDVLVSIPVRTLGDTLAWFRGILDFGKREKCSLHVRIADYIRVLLEPANKDVHFVSDADCALLAPYAAYTVAVFKGAHPETSTACDYRKIPLHHVPFYIFNLPPHDEPPPVFAEPKEDGHSVPDEPYVAIASMASGGVKLWHNANGWEKVVDFLMESGYRVADIDREPMMSCRFFHHRIPAGAEDWTGDEPLPVRAAQIAGADFFIGLGSGLSWLAWCMRKPVVLIGGFSEPWAEFPTPWRIRNPLACHGCFNDTSIEFDNHEFFWCPRHANTERHWECSIGITPQMVVRAIQTIPEFQMTISRRQQNG